MGHVVRTEVYDENVDKKSVQSEWDAVARHAGYKEGASGLLSPIRWIDKTLPDVEAAEAYIDSHDKGWYDQLAVKFLDYSEVKVKETKAYEKLVEKRIDAIRRMNDLEHTFHFANVKSAFIGCKNCGSKISSKYLRTNYCPVCNYDMRPETVQERIKKARQNAKELEKKLAEEQRKMEKKQKKSAKVRWLVKVEWHE